MNQLPLGARYYIMFCLTACGYVSSAAVFAWPNPLPAVLFTSEFWSDEDGGHSYSSGSYHGRSSGGFGGGGK